MATWRDGPLPKEHVERLSLAREIAQRLQSKYTATAVGVYGSIARGQDGPFSDIDLLAVAPGPLEKDWGWLHDGWSIEVTLRDSQSLLCHATTVPGDWSITHSNYLHILPIYDPAQFFSRLVTVINDAPQAAFEEAIKELMMQLYGATSKLRSCQTRGEAPPPGFVYYLVKLGYWMIGLANRHTYSTATAAITESLMLQNRPLGYDPLCQMAINGDIADNQHMFDACESFWCGAAEWAHSRGINLESPEHLL